MTFLVCWQCFGRYFSKNSWHFSSNIFVYLAITFKKYNFAILSLTLIMLVMFYKISKITDNATCLKGSPVPHFSITEFMTLRASFLRYIYSFIAGQIPWDEEQLQWCVGTHQSGLYKRPIYSCMLSYQYLVFKYGRTSTQRPS